MHACIDRVSMLSKRARQLMRCFTIYVIVILVSLCQTFHKDIQSKSRLMNKAVLGMEFKFWHHKISVKLENALLQKGLNIAFALSNPFSCFVVIKDVCKSSAEKVHLNQTALIRKEVS